MTPRQAHAYCTQKAKDSGSNFYYSFLFLPQSQREAMYTVYTFCHEVDATVDHPPPGLNPAEQLTRWRQEVTAIYRGTPHHPVAISLADHVARLAIPEEYLQELLTGMEMDLTYSRYRTFEDLYPYCYRVASVVGLICLKIFGTRDPRAKDYAIQLGLAFQLTNILRDIGADADRNRIYLPQEELARFGYKEQELLAKRYTPQFRNLMAFQCQRARQFYQHARQIYASLPRNDQRTLVAAEIMQAVYGRLLHRIEQRNYSVFGPRIRLSPLHRIGIATTTWLRATIGPYVRLYP
ncbi:MAG: squalene synthase HpnD [Nitrospirae bacterium]|nr:MAG: squalene synthase HpnD [Nitrospirota bacterium]